MLPRAGPSAATGIAQRQVDGALATSGASLRLLVTQAGGAGPEQALSGAFAAVAARSGRQLTVSDVVPPRASDAQALSSWFIVLSVLIPSLAAGSASALAFRRAPRAWSVVAPVALTPLAATGASAATAAAPVMSTAFLQPSGTTIPWTAKQYQSEISLERAAGITGIIDQWTIDEDANQAYYPDASGWYPRSGDMTDPLLSAASQAGDTVWLGLANVSAWQSHAGDASWLSNQLYVDEKTADQLYSLYKSSKPFKGWYVPFEVSDSELGTSADTAPMKSFFSSLTSYLHTHDGDKPVMTSPTYEHLTESPAQFAAAVKSVLGSFDASTSRTAAAAATSSPPTSPTGSPPCTRPWPGPAAPCGTTPTCSPPPTTAAR